MLIENEAQLERTRTWLAHFEEDIQRARLRSCPPNVHPEIHAAGIRAMEAQAEDLRKDIEEWENRPRQ